MRGALGGGGGVGLRDLGSVENIDPHTLNPKP